MSEYEVRINRFRIAAAGNFSCYPKGASRRPYSAIFCFFPIGTTTDNFNYNQKNEDRTFSTTANVYPVSAFQTGNAPIFKHQHRTQFSYQPIKFCLLFFLSEFGIVSGKAQPGSPGMVMESRKAAPALRARLLRSYVPLRRVPGESALSGTIPGLPGGNFLHSQIQIRKAKNFIKNMNFMSILKTMLAVLFFPYYNFKIVTGSLMQDNRICGLAERHLQ
ncbi:MAG: hypothetical protein ACLVJ4_07955 [Mediterraneibacter sp.]